MYSATPLLPKRKPKMKIRDFLAALKNADLDLDSDLTVVRFHDEVDNFACTVENMKVAVIGGTVYLSETYQDGQDSMDSLYWW